MGLITKVFILQSLKTTDILKSGEELNRKLIPIIPTNFKTIKLPKNSLINLMQ